MKYSSPRSSKSRVAKKVRQKFPKDKKEVSLNRHLPFSILYQDRDIIVVDKPAGLLTVPFAGGHSRNLLELLNKHFAREKIRPQVVHRIDRYTSGLVLFAKNPRARDFLVEQFRAHTPERTYLAIIHGAIYPAEGPLVHYLRKNEGNFKQHVTTKRDERGTPARLKYRTIERWQRGSLLEVKLDTGLKNQIRVQLAEVGHPIIGDQQYGTSTPLDERIARQSLHAASLSFVHPTDKTKKLFESPLPRDMHSLLKFLSRPVAKEGANLERPNKERTSKKRTSKERTDIENTAKKVTSKDLAANRMKPNSKKPFNKFNKRPKPGGTHKKAVTKQRNR